MTDPQTAARADAPLGAIAGVLAGALCLSASAVVVKLAGVDAPTTAVLRCALAVVVLVPLALHERSRHGALSGRGIAWAVAAGIALGIDYAAWTASIFFVGAGVSTVLVNVQVIVLPALAFLVDRERVTGRFLLALPLLIVGIGLVGGLWTGTATGPDAVTGTLLGVLAGVGYAVYMFLTRRAAPRDPGRFIQPLTWATAAAAATAAVVAPFTGGIHLTTISGRSWLYLVVLAILGQVVAWLLIHRGSVRLTPATTAALLLVQPVLGLALAALVVGERPTPLQLAGAGVVLVGVAIANGVVRRRRDRGG